MTQRLLGKVALLTGGAGGIGRAIARDPRREKYIEQAHPIGRLGEAEDIARSVVFLSSEDASFIIGHSLAVDGGFTAR